MLKRTLIIVSALLALVASFLLGRFLPKFSTTNSLISPFISETKSKQLPLLEYTINNLVNRQYLASTDFKLEKELNPGQNPEFKTYLFSFTTMDKKMSGAINLPTGEVPAGGYPMIVMLRGWAPAESYYSGMGTKNAAAVLAKNGFITVAPDFFGYGESEADFEDSWKGRFTKPINVIELIQTLRSLESIGLPIDQPLDQVLDSAQPIQKILINPEKLGIWAHSNGGQIALTTLEVLGEPIPTTLWAPVTAPFPYSILFFSDENSDEGKEARAWVALFEKDYDVFEFSLTRHLERLNAPIQLHHGTTDEAALISWSEEFVAKVEAENKSRKEQKIITEESPESTEAAAIKQKISEKNLSLEPIKIDFYKYPGANHNLQPGWDTVVERDVKFFEKWLR